MRSINNIDDDIRFFGKQILNSNLLFKGSAAQTVGSRKIHNLKRGTIIGCLTVFSLYGNGLSRPVTHMLTHAGQIIEQCRLTAVWISGKSNHYTFFTHDSNST